MPADDVRIPKQLGEAVRRLRAEKGFSQFVLAEKADLNANYVGEIERGEKLASVVTAVRIAGALGIKASELFTRARL